MTHRGRPVKWIGADIGWKTGHVVTLDGVPIRKPTAIQNATLVQHSCTNEIEWVESEKLSPWQTREEWEASDEQS
jgi:hypothetical protein